jgi:hypothetical protein
LTQWLSFRAHLAELYTDKAVAQQQKSGDQQPESHINDQRDQSAKKSSLALPPK